MAYTCYVTFMLSFLLSSLNSYSGSPDRDGGVSNRKYLIHISQLTHLYINIHSTHVALEKIKSGDCELHYLFSVFFLLARNPKRLNRY